MLESEDSGEAEPAEEVAPEPLVEATVAEALEETQAKASAESPSPAESTEAGLADTPAAEDEISSLVEETQGPAPIEAAPVQEIKPVPETGGLAAASVEKEVPEAVTELSETVSSVAIEMVKPVDAAEASMVVETSLLEDVPASPAAEEEAIQDIKAAVAVTESVKAVEVASPVAEVGLAVESDSPVVAATLSAKEVPVSPGAAEKAVQQWCTDFVCPAEFLAAAEVTVAAAAGSEEVIPEGPAEAAQVPDSEEAPTVQQQVNFENTI
ncbi:hypothetical protein EOD39_8197 [Acipenser ruthenus]|uniref:Uncharacterized protein n=1 Tax=Acipenser ruthenus TaxID=7906 RepID=A0A444U4K0_ACIRT|nr:hypothetical protein EOD39_8197 [Acipenser ruthenus]